MKRTTVLSSLLTIVAATLLAGCFGVTEMINVQRDQEVFMQRQKLNSKFANNPDTDAWYDARQKLALATGDRVFDKDFARVFDSLALAVATLELKVGNMERTSGYIAASGITLSPTEARGMRREAVNDWCRQNGFDPGILDVPLKSNAYNRMGEMMDFSGMMAKYDKMQKGLTFQLVRMGDSQTKVKLRFSDVYYPGEVENYYKLVWQAVDKQLFVDQNIEGKVEKRNE